MTFEEVKKIIDKTLMYEPDYDEVIGDPDLSLFCHIGF